VHQDLFMQQSLRFVATLEAGAADVVFLCGGHGEAAKLIERHQLGSTRATIIDLSQDFRLVGQHRYVYGLPEAFRERMIGADRIANPGCFATAIQLALLPLAAHGLLEHPVHITGVTGSTGAGQKLSETSHYSWRSNNLSVYKAFEHQHLAEIKQTLGLLQANQAHELLFVPMRGSFPRGILCSLHTRLTADFRYVQEIYTRYYQAAPFVHLIEGEVHIKQVVNTNQTVLALEKHGDYLHIVSCIDNLLKGASGQAVQNMNLSFGRPETEGLHLKPLAF
jgi:N-acetyl-gamma-glutamyl-phosphate reductase